MSAEGGLRTLVRVAGATVPEPAAVTGVRYDLSVSETAQAVVTVLDEGLRWWSATLLRAGLPAEVDVAGRTWRMALAAVEVGPGPAGTGEVTLTLRPAAVRALQERTGPLRMADTSASGFVERECAAVGVDVIAEPTAVRPEVVRDVDGDRPSSWSTFARLAREEGLVVVADGRSVLLGRPTWLLDRLGGTPLVCAWPSREGAEVDALPACRRSLDDPDAAVTVGLSLPASRLAEVTLTGRARLEGVSRFAGDYFVSAVAHDVGSARVDVSVTVPRDPTAEAAGGVRPEVASLADPDADPATAPAAPPSAVWSARAVTEVPPGWLEVYAAAADRFPSVVDRCHLAAVGWVETRHRVGLVSSAGAKGPMQFMPGTWREYATDGDGDGRADINDHRDAIHAAARYFVDLAVRYARYTRGELRRTLAAYNAGPGNIGAGLGYADKVMRTAREYRA